jgi:hypothetical protein
VAEVEKLGEELVLMLVTSPGQVSAGRSQHRRVFPAAAVLAIL